MPIVIFFFSPAFQSTPSAWRETNVLPNPMPNHGISIHSLRMEGDPLTAQLETIAFISIHSLRMEGDPSTLIYTVLLSIFQSTPSAWRETVFRFQEFCKLVISIHSLRMEGDAGFSAVGM